MLKLDDIAAEIGVRRAHLSKLRQPGPVDLSDDGDDSDNSVDQDTLFQELRVLDDLEAVLHRHML